MGEGVRVVRYHGEALATLRGLADESADAVVTDPPYEIGFTGRMARVGLVAQ